MGGLYYQLSDLAGYRGGTSAVSLSGPSNTCSRGLLQDNEGDICCSPCLGLYYQLSDLAGYRGRRLPSLCLGLLIPARGAYCRIMREIYAVLPHYPAKGLR